MPTDQEIRQQVDFYFHDKRFPSDTFLKQQVGNDGWVPLSTLTSFPKLRELSGGSVSRVARAIWASPSCIVQLDSHGRNVRRKALEKRISAHISFWFSPGNWDKDLHLQLLAEENGGFVPIEAPHGTSSDNGLLGFKTLKDLFDAEGIAESDRACRLKSAIGGFIDVELSSEGIGIRQSGLPRRVRLQIEKYFSNMAMSKVMQDLASEDPDGFIPLRVLMEFPRLRSMLHHLCRPENVARTLSTSTYVELNSDHTGVRLRKQVIDANESKGIDEVPQVVQVIQGQSYLFLPSPMARATDKPSFTFMTMNILAQHLALSGMHAYCSTRYLQWDHRKQLLLDGLKRAKPDIVCLQEVVGVAGIGHSAHLQNDFIGLAKALEAIGYVCPAYALKADCQGVALKGPQIGDALFFNKDIWHLVDRGRIAFAQELASRCVAGGAAKNQQLQHYTQGKQVAAWARLRHRETGRVVCAVSAHISCNFKNPDTQVAQVDALLAYLESYMRPDDAVVLGGDFNSQPDSGVYKLLSQGMLPASDPDASSSNHAIPPLCDSTGFRHGLKLNSAYAGVNGKEPVLTTKTGKASSVHSGFEGTLDYIWYSREKIRPVSGTALQTPTPAQASAEGRGGGGFPNSYVPSDHVPLGVAFEFC
jgi:mRNA deadenylase 3'-5' endonuclease subunit Ccr4